MVADEAYYLKPPIDSAKKKRRLLACVRLHGFCVVLYKNTPNFNMLYHMLYGKRRKKLDELAKIFLPRVRTMALGEVVFAECS